MKQKGSGILKKLKGKWVPVIVSGGIALGIGGVLATDGVLAQVNSAAVSVMSNLNSTNFENKDTYTNDELIQLESEAALDKITSFWSFNSVEEVREEIERQEKAGLDAYVIQWGDTLSVLSEATGRSVEELAELNNIGNLNLILTGDILNGVLNTEENVSSNSEDNHSQDEEQVQEEEQTQTTEADDVDPSPEAAGYAQDLIEQETDSDFLGNASSSSEDESVKFFKVTEDIKFGTKYVPVEDLAKGEERVIQEGKDGLVVSYYAEKTLADGTVEKSELIKSESESYDAVDRIVEIGVESTEDSADDNVTEPEPEETDQEDTEAEETTPDVRKETVTDPIPYETETRETDELLLGETRVIQEGIDGEQVTTYEVTFEDGEEVDRQEVSTEVTKEVVNEIVEVGTAEESAPEEPEEDSSEEPTDPETPEESEEDQEDDSSEEPTEPEVPEEEQEDDTSGEPTKPEVPEEPEEDQEEATEEPEQEPEVNEVSRTETEEIPFETEYRNNDEVDSGSETIIRSGENGIREITYVDTVIDGEIVSTEEVSNEIVKNPINQIVERGTRTVETKTEYVEEVISHSVTRRENPNMNVGEERVVQEGQDGVWEVPYEVTYVNGEETSRVRSNDTDSFNVLRPSKGRIVEYGTRQPEAPVHSGTKVDNVVYRTLLGETVQSVANKFGTTAERIRRDNGLSSNSLSHGTRLVINGATAQPMDIPQSRDNRKVVILDAGHGGSDPGATSSGRQEKTINLQMANQLRDKLTNRGYEVQMVRDGDVAIRNLNRSRTANDSDADIYVSIHQNAHNGTANGIETFYYLYHSNYQSAINDEYHNDGTRIANSKHLAELVQSAMINETGANDRGVKRASFEVLRETDIPAILLEAGFIDNSAEGRKLADPAYQNRLMESVADAIDQYFKDVHGQ